MAKASPNKKSYTVWVRMNTLVGFKVVAESTETALATAQSELPHKQLLNDGIEYMDGNERVVGIMEDD